MKLELEIYYMTTLLTVEDNNIKHKRKEKYSRPNIQV